VWDVEVTLNGVTKTVAIAEGTSLLDAAEGVRFIQSLLMLLLLS
jgi:hypothetical protein